MFLQGILHDYSKWFFLKKHYMRTLCVDTCNVVNHKRFDNIITFLLFTGNEEGI